MCLTVIETEVNKILYNKVAVSSTLYVTLVHRTKPQTTASFMVSTSLLPVIYFIGRAQE